MDEILGIFSHKILIILEHLHAQIFFLDADCKQVGFTHAQGMLEIFSDLWALYEFDF